MNAVRNGVTDNLHALRPDYARAGIRTWPQILAASGYYTAAVGKMHFYPWDARHGFQYRVVCEDKLWSLIRDDYYHYLKDHGLRKLRWQEYGEYLERKGVAHTDVPWEHSWDRYTGTRGPALHRRPRQRRPLRADGRVSRSPRPVRPRE